MLNIKSIVLLPVLFIISSCNVYGPDLLVDSGSSNSGSTGIGGTGGNSSSSMQDACVPRFKCPDKNGCSILDDGCGNVADCGECSKENYQTSCGLEGYDENGDYLPATPNVCGGGCQALSPSPDCPFVMTPHEWKCLVPEQAGNLPPIGLPCVAAPVAVNPDKTVWCCENGK